MLRAAATFGEPPPLPTSQPLLGKKQEVKVVRVLPRRN